MVRKIFQPLVQHDIAAPAQVQLTLMLVEKFPQHHMALPIANHHGFGETTVEIRTDRNIRIEY